MKRRKMNEESISNSDYSAGIATGYLYARTEDAINSAAASSGGTVTEDELTRRLGQLLLAKAGGRVLDSAERVSTVWRKTAKGYGQRSAKKKVHVRAHGSRPRELRTKKHWTQLPENRAKVLKTLRAVKRGFNKYQKWRKQEQ